MIPPKIGSYSKNFIPKLLGFFHVFSIEKCMKQPLTSRRGTKKYTTPQKSNIDTKNKMPCFKRRHTFSKAHQLIKGPNEPREKKQKRGPLLAIEILVV